MKDYATIFSGGDLRSTGRANEIVQTIKTQQTFDELFAFLFYHARKVVMRVADAVEKISMTKPAFLSKHKSQLLKLLNEAENKELKWHLAQLIPWLSLSGQQTQKAFKTLSGWMLNTSESRIVRVNAMQALFDLSANSQKLRNKFLELASNKEFAAIPSLKARLKKLLFKSST